MATKLTQKERDMMTGIKVVRKKRRLTEREIQCLRELERKRRRK